jgi:cardiolipin synthase A/B
VSERATRGQIVSVATSLAVVAMLTLAGTTASGAAAPRAVRWRVMVEPAAGYGFLDHAVAAARHSVLVEMYELADPVFEDTLVADVHRHVHVQVLLDEDYDAGSVNQPAFALLTARHVAVRWANRAYLFHEKAVVVDGAVAYVGTGNLTAQYYATTRDFWVVDVQHADIDAVATTFRTDWGGAAPAPGPRGADLVWSPGAEATFLSLIDRAHHTISIESEELSDAYVLSALAAAARRHVVVHVTMTYSTAWRSAFDQLVAAGVQVHVDHGEHPIYIHAKALCVDCTTGPHATGSLLVGSQNLSYTSLAFNRELSLGTSAAALVSPIDTVLRADFSAASPYTG